MVEMPFDVDREMRLLVDDDALGSCVDDNFDVRCMEKSNAGGR